MMRVAAVLLLPALLPLTGCLQDGVKQQEAPDVRMFLEGRSDVHVLVGREAWADGMRGHLFAHEEGTEGGDFGLTFDWHGDGRLSHSGTQEGRFRFAYTEAVFWAGEPVCRVTDVDPASWLEVDWTGDVGASRGSYDLRFTGDCPEQRDNGPHARHVHGSW